MEGIRVGSLIRIQDDIDPSMYHDGIIVYIEPDDEMEDLLWYYVRSNEESFNTQTDPKLNRTFWRLIESCSNKIISIN